MVGATGPRMLRLTAELADHWNGGLRTPDELRPLLDALEDACRKAGREPGSLTRSAEVRVRTVAAPPDVEPEEREVRGAPDELVAALLAYAELGIDHLQVQVRPNTAAGVAAFGPVIERLSQSVD